MRLPHLSPADVFSPRGIYSLSASTSLGASRSIGTVQSPSSSGALNVYLPSLSSSNLRNGSQRTDDCVGADRMWSRRREIYFTAATCQYCFKRFAEQYSTCDR